MVRKKLKARFRNHEKVNADLEQLLVANLAMEELWQSLDVRESTYESPYGTDVYQRQVTEPTIQLLALTNYTPEYTGQINVAQDFSEGMDRVPESAPSEDPASHNQRVAIARAAVFSQNYDDLDNKLQTAVQNAHTASTQVQEAIHFYDNPVLYLERDMTEEQCEEKLGEAIETVQTHGEFIFTLDPSKLYKKLENLRSWIEEQLTFCGYDSAPLEQVDKALDMKYLQHVESFEGELDPKIIQDVRLYELQKLKGV